LVEQQHPASSSSLPAADDAVRLSQVRDLLFGEQSRATDSRLERLQAELERLRELLRGELGALRAGLTEELSELRRALGVEREQRGADLRAGQAALDDTRGALERALAGSEQRAQTGLDDVAGRLEDERRAVRGELGRLAHAKLDRDTLAALLSELAQRVTDEGEG
jgi:hypothetical protein